MTQVYVNEICPSTTQAWIKKGALLADVRENDEVQEIKFDVPQIIHIPLSQFEERYTELPTDKNLVIVCHDGTRSIRAAAWLIHKGYDPEKVVNMRHGLVRWVHKGFPVVGDASVVEPSGHTGCCGGHTHHDHSHEQEHGHDHNHGSCCGGH
ncbi:MAG: rhodanese-like domain-containing protein [Chitinophagaceae bacterium]|nr:rhodanese-like domain-containing protein [Chitinophagaceae bacterium]